MKKHYDLKASLRPFLASEAVLDETIRLLQMYPIHLGLMGARRGVYGDYRSAALAGWHKITVNGDLNPHAFFLTFLHEYAHLLVFVEHGPRVQAHGVEWKQAYRKLAFAAMEKGLFPGDICKALHGYFRTTPASTARDVELVKVLASYDQEKKEGVFLEDLAMGERFYYNGKIFQKGQKRRKNYICVSLTNGLLHSFSPIARVQKERD